MANNKNLMFFLAFYINCHPVSDWYYTNKIIIPQNWLSFLTSCAMSADIKFAKVDYYDVDFPFVLGLELWHEL